MTKRRGLIDLNSLNDVCGNILFVLNLGLWKVDHLRISPVKSLAQMFQMYQRFIMKNLVMIS